MPVIEFINEFELSESDKAEIAVLRRLGFPESKYPGRTFFKQLPHYRLLLKENNKVFGQSGIDYRVMNLNGELVRVFGVIDLVIHPDHQGQGFGTLLMKELDRIANAHSNNIDFIYLVTDKPGFYERLGYVSSRLNVTWLKIHQERNYGLGNEVITDSSLMHKEISEKKWTDGDLDMLGYLY